MVPVLSTPPFCLRPAYWPGVGVANCCDALMLILPFPEELMNALGAGAPAEGVNAEEVTLDRLPIMLPSMYHINGLLTPPLWGVVLVAGAALEANAVDVGSPAFAGASSILASFVVSTLSQEKFKSGVSLLSDVPATLAAASQSSLLWYTGMDIACVAARLERVSASFCTPQAASAENTTATAAVFAKRWHRTDQVMPVSSIRAGAFRVRIVLLIVSVYHMKTGLSTDYFSVLMARRRMSPGVMFSRLAVSSNHATCSVKIWVVTVRSTRPAMSGSPTLSCEDLWVRTDAVIVCSGMNSWSHSV